MINHFVSSAIITSIASTLVAVGLLIRSRRRLYGIFALYWFCISFWSFFVGTQYHLLETISEIWWGRLLHLGAFFIPFCFFHFACEWSGQSFYERRRIVLAYVIGVALSVLNISTSIITDGIVHRDAYAYPKPTIFYCIYFGAFVYFVIRGTVLMIRSVKQSPLGIQKCFRFFLISHVFAYAGAMDNFLIMVDVRIFPLYPYGLYMVPIYACVTQWCMVKHNFLRFSEVRNQLLLDKSELDVRVNSACQ